MNNKVKSGKEVLDDFFNEIKENKKIDKNLSNALAGLYAQGKFTESNVKILLQTLREKDVNKNQKPLY